MAALLSVPSAPRTRWGIRKTLPSANHMGLSGTLNNYSHTTDKETEAQEIEVQGLRSGRQQRWLSYVVSPKIRT